MHIKVIAPNMDERVPAHSLRDSEKDEMQKTSRNGTRTHRREYYQCCRYLMNVLGIGGKYKLFLTFGETIHDSSKRLA
jgi:hypothetical protein